MTAYQALPSEHQRHQRRLEATLVCPELQVDRYGFVQLDDAVRGSFMRLLRLELNLSPVPQLVQLTDGLEGSGGLEEGGLATQRFTLPLPDDARVLGFKYWEASDPVTGFSDIRDPHVLLDVDGQLFLEPLSRRYLGVGSVKFPGRLQWMPAALESLEKGAEKLAISTFPEVVGLRIIRGSVDHIVDCLYAQRWTCTPGAVRSLTGQPTMFWVELFLLTLALFYLDIALDLKQLWLFWQEKLFGYFTVNLAGMTLPPTFTMLEAVRFSARPSPECDQLKKLLTPKMVVPVMLLSILTQTHMVLLVAASALSRRKHPLLAGAKGAEVAESAVSALVQTNFLVSALDGIGQIEALELSRGQLNSMKLSVLVSCLSLGLGFAGRDKDDSAVLDLPGKVGWGLTMGGLVLARSLEVFSRILAYNFLQASLRGFPLLRLAGLGAVATAFLAACVAFPDASWADVAAAVIAHPGQILEPNSLLKLRYSLMIHVVLVAAAGGAQLLLRMSTAPPACKVLPDILLIGWLVISLVSWAALGLLRWLGNYVDQPRFVALSSPVIAYSTLLAAFPSPDGQVPKVVLAALKDRHTVDLTTHAAAHGLKKPGLEGILDFNVDSCYDGGVLLGLGCSQEAVVRSLEQYQDHPASLHLQNFRSVGADAWERLGASLGSERLQKVDLSLCFDFGTGAVPLFAGLARCPELKELIMDTCYAPGAAWGEFQRAEWTKLRKASFKGCFKLRGDGSENLLSALGRSPQLQEANFQDWHRAPENAWALLGDGAWPGLRVAKGIPEEHRERLCKASPDVGSGQSAASLELQELGAQKIAMYPTLITSVMMPRAAAEVQQDPRLLPALGHCQLEELNLDWCTDVPASVWQELGQRADFQLLTRASFVECFNHESEGAEGASGLLSALRACRNLQELNMAGCYEVPAASWQLLATASWEQLRKAKFSRCFDRSSKGAEGAAGLLSALSRCQQLQELFLCQCEQIPATAWQQLETGAGWEKLKKVSVSECFGGDCKGTEGAAALLKVLACCPELQVLDMDECSQIPATAWRQLEGAKWKKLTDMRLQRCFRRDAQGTDGMAELFTALARCPELKQERVQQLWPEHRAELCRRLGQQPRADGPVQPVFVSG